MQNILSDFVKYLKFLSLSDKSLNIMLESF